jgi:hypothetical protein
MPITIDQLDEAHAQDALSILSADANQPVYAGVAPNAVTPPYELVYTTVELTGEGDGKTLDATTSTCVTRWYTHSVGATDQSTRAIANRVRQLLVNVHPTISGRTCGLIQQEAALPVSRDERTGALIQDLAAVYILTTFPG